MKLKFKHQSYQDDAVKSLVNCFLGQKKGSRKDLIARYKHTVDTGLFAHEEEVEVISFGNNSITLTESERVKNIREVQRLNDINYTDGQPLDEFTIEMETGTGKTFTYIKSMYELNKEYGWSKFIVVVPSIAIKEGVHKSTIAVRKRVIAFVDNWGIYGLCYAKRAVHKGIQEYTENTDGKARLVKAVSVMHLRRAGQKRGNYKTDGKTANQRENNANPVNSDNVETVICHSVSEAQLTHEGRERGREECDMYVVAYSLLHYQAKPSNWIQKDSI